MLKKFRLLRTPIWRWHWNFRFCGFGYFLDRFLCQKNFGFSVLMFIAVCGFSAIYHLVFGFREKIPAGFRIWYPMQFSVFPIWPIWVPVSLRSEWQFTRLHWSRIAAKRKCYWEDKPIKILGAREPRLCFTLGGEDTAIRLIPRGLTSLELCPRLWPSVGVHASWMTNMVQQ